MPHISTFQANRPTVLSRFRLATLVGLSLALHVSTAIAEDKFESWAPLKSSFPSTGGGGITIKGYDPVITGKTCVTTFMAVESGDNPKVYPAFIEFEATAVAGGILCQNGQWRMMDGSNSGTTPFRVFFKDGVFRASPG